MEKRQHAEDFLFARLGLGGPQVDLGRIGGKIGMAEARGFGETVSEDLNEPDIGRAV